MAELKIDINIPLGLESRFESALSKVVEQFVRRIEFSIANEILSKSELTEANIEKLSNDLKERVAKKHGL